MRFDPFKTLPGKYGAPMGRNGDDPESFPDGVRLYARHCGGDGYYDRGGAYWGHSKVCAVWTRGGEFCAYIEAHSPKTAIQIVQEARA